VGQIKHFFCTSPTCYHWVKLVKPLKKIIYSLLWKNSFKEPSLKGFTLVSQCIVEEKKMARVMAI